MKTVTLTIILFFCLLTLALAHEFWLQPATFFADKNQSVRLQLRVGENFSGEPWNAGVSRVIRFQSFLKEKKTDWMTMLNNRGLDSLELRFPKTGTHLVVLATNNKFLSLEAEKFNDYLVEDGLEHVLEWRKQHDETQQPSRELYRREAASLVQVGKLTNKVLFEKTEFDLQLLPERNPISMKPGESLRCQICFQGKPVAGALVRYWVKSPDKKTTMIQKRSDSSGWVQFPLLSGDNMISVVWMYRLNHFEEAGWQSIWGNLTFGVK